VENIPTNKKIEWFPNFLSIVIIHVRCVWYEPVICSGGREFGLSDIHLTGFKRMFWFI
jgi:hypothetical protein